MWLEHGDVSCTHCLGLRTAFLRLDKRGRPYLSCSACGSKSFIGLRAALAGSAILSPIIEQLAEQAARDPEYAAKLEHVKEAFFADVQRRLGVVPAAPASDSHAAEPVPATKVA